MSTYFEYLEKSYVVIRLVLAAAGITGFLAFADFLYLRPEVSAHFENSSIAPHYTFLRTRFVQYYELLGIEIPNQVAEFIDSDFFDEVETFSMIRTILTPPPPPTDKYWKILPSPLLGQDEGVLFQGADSLVGRIHLSSISPILQDRPSLDVLMKVSSDFKLLLSAYDYTILLRALLYAKTYFNQLNITNSGGAKASQVRVTIYGFELVYLKGEILFLESTSQIDRITYGDRHCMLEIPELPPCARSFQVYSNIGNLNSNHITIEYSGPRYSRGGLYILIFIAVFAGFLLTPLLLQKKKEPQVTEDAD